VLIVLLTKTAKFSSVEECACVKQHAELMGYRGMLSR